MAIRKTPGKGGKKGGKKDDSVSIKVVGLRVYKREEKEFYAVVKGEFKGNEAGAARELVSEALTNRRLREAGRDSRLSAVKETQKEVVSGELAEVKTSLAQILSILRGQGSTTAQILTKSMSMVEVLKLILGSVLHIEEISEEHILKLILSGKGIQEKEILATIESGEAHWQSQAKTMVEKVEISVTEGGI